ncbi:hypothetical protein CVT25_014906 [Psilocybe cyanescens]|uniref:Uncharacterized protein n=1 Tax=Psilocybe cyanescens TaxID=93625 RepID=A0A409WF35_PSICY|nr:hypothetical protein CVT25_014906 [Psilocybe cyanescens]
MDGIGLGGRRGEGERKGVGCTLRLPVEHDTEVEQHNGGDLDDDEARDEDDYGAEEYRPPEDVERVRVVLDCGKRVRVGLVSEGGQGWVGEICEDLDLLKE